MSKVHRNDTFDARTDALFAGKRRKTPPHEFVLDALSPASPMTRPMFGCVAVYVEDKIVLVLRDKGSSVECARRLNFDPPCRLNIDPGTGGGSAPNPLNGNAVEQNGTMIIAG